ncbi:MAG: hypothetical protein AAFV88_11630 [Planctomycetota bacterium]
MKQFCDRFSSRPYRFDMREPFVESGNASASDGRVGVRVFDTMGLADTGKPLSIPPLDRTFKQLWKPNSKWTPAPKPDFQGSEFGCPRCQGYGYLGTLTDCDKCFSFEPDEFGNESANCTHCVDGLIGRQVCPDCKGKPDERRSGYQQITDELQVAESYYRKILQLPDMEINHSTGYERPPHSRAVGHVLLFRFQGGEGMLMGLDLKRSK